MKRILQMKKLYWTLAVLAGGLALATGPARAQTICTGTLAAGAYTNVSVPKNAVCVLGVGVTVTGNVTVASGAAMGIHGATVNGSVLSNDANTVDLELAHVGTNVSLVGTTIEAVAIESMIGGNVQIIGNTAGSEIFVRGSTVTGNVLLQSNTTAAGEDLIPGNTIGGNLTCVGNAPPPSNEGSPNNVSGNEVGQCAGL